MRKYRLKKGQPEYTVISSTMRRTAAGKMPMPALAEASDDVRYGFPPEMKCTPSKKIEAFSSDFFRSGEGQTDRRA